MTTSDAKAPGGLDVTALLAAPGLSSTLGDRLQAADANGDGVISASEMLDVLQSESDAIRDNKMMKRALIALGVACLLIIAAVVGLTYAVVEMSKDTGVENNVLVSKDGLQPLSTATLQKRVQLADLYKAGSPSELDWLTHVTVPFGEGEAVLKIQNAYLVPGQSVRFDTAAEGVSVEVTADGVTVSGDEQAPGGRRRLMQEDSGNVTAIGDMVGESGVGDADNEDTPAASPPSPESPESPESPTNGTSSSDGGSTPAASPPSPESPTPPESPTNGTTGSDGGSTPVTRIPAAASTSSTSPTAFYKEGDTIKCPNAKVGDTGVVDGVTYTKRDRGGLAGLVNGDSSKLSTSCTTGVTDMGFMWVLTSPAVRSPAPTRSRSRSRSLRASLAREKGAVILAASALSDASQLLQQHQQEAVIFVTSHDANGTTGVMLNRPTSLVLSRTLIQDETGESKLKHLFAENVLYMGGASMQEHVQVIHSEGTS